MNVVEAVGKALLREAGLGVPEGALVTDADAAAGVAERLGGRVALKAQIAAGKRGKAGGIRFVLGGSEAAAVAREMLHGTLNGHVVEALLVEAAVPIERELYAAVMNDPVAASPLVLFSTSGGMDIEDVPAAHIVRRPIDIRRGLSLEAARNIVGATDLAAASVEAVARALTILYEVYVESDAELLEINPLVVTGRGTACALDCKLVLDDSARRRHEALFASASEGFGAEGTELERRARALGLLYMELDGDIGILANGAGLTMMTMDVVKHFGGRAANFMEIGGDAYAKATPALEIVLANPNVRSLLVNFCGAFAQTDVMARGVADAILAIRPDIPMAFSIHGTGEDAAIAIVRDELGIEPYDSMDDAVRAAIDAAAAQRPVTSFCS